MRLRRFETLVYMGWTHSLNHGLLTAITPLIPVIILEEYSYTMIGILLSLYLFLYSFGSLFSALLLRLMEDRKILFLSIMLQGASTLFLFLPGLTGLSLFLISSGAAASLYHPVANVFIFNRFREKVNVAMGIHGTGGNFAQFIFPLLSFFLAANFGWRTALLTIGLVICLSSIPYLATCRTEKRMMETEGFFKGFIKVVSHRQLWHLMFFSLIFGLYYRGVEVFLPAYLNSEKGFSEEASSITLSILLLAGAFGQYFGGLIGDRLNEATVLLSASIVGLASLILLQTASGYMLLTLATVLLGLAFYSHQPAANSLLGKKSLEGLRDYSYGFWFFISFLSSSPSTLMVSIIGQQFGFANSILFSTVIALIPLALATYIYRKLGG
ncbi:MAG: MFS transporter [Thermoproteota archaeon]